MRRMTYLQFAELEISAWRPLPRAFSAFRALASEFTIYVPTIVMIIFLHDLEQTVLRRADDGRWIPDDESNTDTLWRDV
jgi:hypothetical protein